MDMATNQTTLKIQAENLGTVSEVKDFLSAIENAYNSLYAFDFIVEALNAEFREKRQRFNDLPPYREFFIYDYYILLKSILPNLIEFQTKIDINNIILPNDRLLVSKINIQSPGFWEFAGSVMPLQQLREYLKDRHERKKDNEYRNKQERRKGDLDILEKENGVIKQRIEILKSLGYSDLEIRTLVSALVTQPLNRLNAHQDAGLLHDYPFAVFSADWSDSAKAWLVSVAPEMISTCALCAWMASWVSWGSA